MEKEAGDDYRFLKILGLFTILILIIVPTFISANTFQDFLDAITGKATSATTTVSIAIGADAPNVSIVSLNDTKTIVAGGIRSFELSAIVNDTNGDMNVSRGAVTANITLLGTTFTNNTCILTSGNSSGGNWSCTMDINFFNPAGDWKVSVQAIDNASLSYDNSSRFFTLSTTTAMNMTSTALSFPSSAPGALNITSSNDPDIVANIGNAVYLNITVTGINLLGDTVSTTSIPAANFTVSNATGALNPECTSTTIFGAALVNNTATNIGGANISRGLYANNSIYFCLRGVPTSVTTQTYSTGGTPDEDDWTVAVAA
ncbi:hypothetical protein HZA98_00025 [Candidatus Woesearchaeota archaeon]|nr:hypothetical protein [Candidatus Woesearchaeota archaeon]